MYLFVVSKDFTKLHFIARILYTDLYTDANFTKKARKTMPKMPNNITDASLKKLEPLNNKQTTYSDALRKGFVIVVSPKGSKSFLPIHH